MNLCVCVIDSVLVSLPRYYVCDVHKDECVHVWACGILVFYQTPLVTKFEQINKKNEKNKEINNVKIKASAKQNEFYCF